MKLNDADRIYLGSSAARRVYAGANKVWPSFPLVNNVATTIRTASAAPHVVNMPSGIVAGDLLLVVIGVLGISSVSAGWTALDTTTAQYRIATGTSADALSVTATGTFTLTAVAYCISDYVGVPVSASVQATSATHDPPAVTPAWGLKNTLWFVQASSSTAVGTGFISFPANYDHPYYLIPSGTSNSIFRLWTARRRLRAATEDPGPLTSGVSVAVRARTIAVQGIS